jgi:DNA-binding response OmpR family regulator
MIELLEKYRVLYVEDDKIIQKNVEEYLDGYFEKVYLADNGKDALNIYKSKQPDVIILDIEIPFIDGLTVAKEIRRENKQIPIVMLTAYTETEKLLQATELNLCKYLVKPVRPKDFKEAILNIARVVEENERDYIHLKENYKWHIKTKELFNKNKKILLSEKERLLLELFLNTYRYVSYEDIMATLWIDEFEKEISIESVKQQVSLLRKKLPKDTIKNIYGEGYKLY